MADDALHARLIKDAQRVDEAAVAGRAFAELAEMHFVALALVAVAAAMTRAHLRCFGFAAVGRYAVCLRIGALACRSIELWIALTLAAIAETVAAAFFAVVAAQKCKNN